MNWLVLAKALRLGGNKVVGALTDDHGVMIALSWY